VPREERAERGGVLRRQGIVRSVAAVIEQDGGERSATGGPKEPGAQAQPATPHRHGLGPVWALA
jgi:hypothetical protein